MAESIMDGQKQFEKKIRAIIQFLDKQNLSLQTYIKENDNRRRELLATISGVGFQHIPSVVPPLEKFAIANGKLLSSQQIKNLNLDNYDVILNYTERIISARKDPGKRTKLEKCNCKNIGPHKLKLLRYMFENPETPICEETIDRVYGNVASMSPGTLAKTIGEIRKCLWNGPYIITELDWGEYISHTGSVYLLNPNYKYLVIRYQL